ncbi:MAG: hypothetical protein COZ85_03845, partial [Candidatus Moranbacteria bacterium CG_4_8_14_3_um_filter_34_16]
MEKQKYKKIGLGILGFAILLVGTFGIYKLYQSKNSILGKEFNSRFDLSVEKASLDGIKSDSVFIFRSKIKLSEKEVRDILKFDPVLDFEVKKVYEKIAGVQIALADSGQEGAGTVLAYEIKPKEELQKGLVYKASVSDPQYADHEYGWSFQIKAPFQVIKTHPRNKGTSVPVNSGIEIAFNREKIGEGKDFFEINPKVSGKFETKGNTFTFIPEKLKEKTIYEVTIKKGLKNQEGGEILEKDFKFTFETASLEKENNKGSFAFDSDFLEFIPGKKPVFSVYTSDVKKEDLKLDVYRIATADEFSKLYLENYREDYTWTRYNRSDSSGKNDLSKFEKILSINPEIIKTEEYGRSFIELPQNLENGFYIFDATFINKHNQVWVQVNSLSSYYAISDEKGLVWSYDFLKKEPQKGTEVFFLAKGKNEISLGKTDEEGILNFSNLENLKEKNNIEYKSDPALLKIEKDGAIGFLALGNKKTQKGNLYWSHLSSDRSIYRMTDKVKFWGVVKGRKTDMREKKVTVEMHRGFGMGEYLPYSSSEEPLDSKELMISRFDSMSGEFSFKGYTPGYYYLKVKFGEEEIANTMIEILTYSKPAYQIEATPSKEKIFAGEDVSFHIKSSFFDGTAVSGLELEYSSWGGNNFNGEIKLDENGEADLVYSSKYDDQKKRQISSSFTLNVLPKYSEEGEISGSANVQIFGPNIYLQSFYEGGDNQESQFKAKLNKVDLSGKEYLGEPVAEHTVKAEIYKITYEKKENGEYYDPIEKVSRKKYDFKRKEEKMEYFEGKTDKNGEWKFGKKLNWENEIYYKIIFSVKDDNGRIMEDELYPYNRSYFLPSNIFETSLSINGENYSDELKFGEKAKLELKISGDKKEDHSAILFFRYQNNIDKFWINSEGKLEDEFLESMAPSVKYKAVVLGPFGFEEADPVQALLDRSEKKLNVKIDPEKEKYAPKEKAKVNLEITDKNNSPIEAEINVSAVDEALFHILPYDWQKEIFSDLYVPIYTYIISGGSKYTQISANGAERGGCFLGGTKITMNDGKKKSIEDIKI